MKKKIVLLAVALGLLLPGMNALAFEGGLLNGLKSDSGKDTWTDGSRALYGFLSEETFTLPNIANVTDYQIDYETGVSKRPVMIFYDIDFNEIGRVTANTDNIKTAVAFTGVKTIKLITSDNSTNPERVGVAEFDVFGEYIEPPPVGEVFEILVKTEHDSVFLEWKKPDGDRLKEINIYRNGEKVETVTGTEYEDLSLQPETTYSYKITTVSIEGVESEGVETTVKTKPIPQAGEVSELKAKATHERVDLSWRLPETEFFKHVNIYRDEVPEVAFIDQILGVKIASAAATTKIFETNGTYFNDLTVDSEKKYEYTLTTTSTEGAESEGITTIVETPEAPPPEIIGGEYTKDPATGDFIYSWEEPTEGQVKVQLDGVDYKTVDSADQQIVIPASEMKYDSLGSPLIALQPIGENGKAGEVVAPGVLKDVKIPFGPSDLLGGSAALVGVIAGFLILALSFLLVPRLIRLIKRALGKESEKEAAARNERTRQRVERQERKEKAAAERLAKASKALKEAKEPKAERLAASDKIAPTERQRKQTLSYATGPAVKEPRTPKAPRNTRERTPKAPRIPRERNRRERPQRPGRG